MNSVKGKTSQRSPAFKEELRSFGALIFNTEEIIREIAFYSSQAQYISYYQGLLDELVHRQRKIAYLTSDLNDPSLLERRDNFFPFYSKLFLPLTFTILTSPVVITTIPDLQQYKIKRTFSGTNYVYTFHSMVSTHMMYRKGAFDYYDTIFCVGPYQVEEIRRTEKLYHLPAKALFEVGYYRLEKIHAEHFALRAKQEETNTQPLALIATGWQESNILNTCAGELVSSLLKEGFKVVFRPHPMTIAKSPGRLDALKKEYKANSDFRIDTETTSEKYLHTADVMICDWSGVALEYAFGTERPVLFIDLPRKVYNPEYENLGIEPLEVRIRNQIGRSIRPEQVSMAGEIVNDFIKHQQEYREQIIFTREQNIYNFGESTRVGADIVENILKEGIKGASQPW